MENYKTMQVWVKKGHRLHGYFEEMCSNAKNMFNTTNFASSLFKINRPWLY
jgi:putative transposase